MSSSPGENVVPSFRAPNQRGEMPDATAAEIDAELSDHLATATERLQQQGVPPAAARAQAQEQFGDVTKVGRRCYWIKQGDTIMFRTVLIVLLIALAIGLAVTTLASWQAQSRMAEQMNALAEHLKSLAESQKAPPAVAPAPVGEQPLDIKGKVYFGTVDQPAANTEVLICRLSDGEIVRRVMSDENGLYQSGPLVAGDYTLLVKLRTSRPWPQKMGVQTAPVYLYAGTPHVGIDIDASRRAGHLALELSRPLPQVVEKEYKIDSRLYFEAFSTQMQELRWTTERPMPERWPIWVMDTDTAPRPSSDGRSGQGFVQHRTALLSNADLASGSRVKFLDGDELPLGGCSLVARVVADILPTGYEDLAKIPNFGPPTRSSTPAQGWMSQQWVFSATLGQLWEVKLRGARQLVKNRPASLTSSWFLYLDPQITAKAVIEEGRVARLRVEIPDDLETRIQNLIQTHTDPENYLEAVRKEYPFIRPAKVTVLGTEPVVEKPIEPAASASVQ